MAFSFALALYNSKLLKTEETVVLIRTAIGQNGAP
jgi:hypothetical protein